MAGSEPSRSYRDDPRWQAEQAAYVADYPHLNSEMEFLTRAAAAYGMYLIEVEYCGGGKQPMSFIEGIRRAFPKQEIRS